MATEISLGGIPEELIPLKITGIQTGSIQEGPRSITELEEEIEGDLVRARRATREPEDIPEIIEDEDLTYEVEQDGKKVVRNYLDEEKRAVNEAEIYRGVVRLDEIEFERRGRPSRNYALRGLLPLNTRDRRELYNLLRDIRVPGIVIPLVWGILNIYGSISQSRTEAWRQEQLMPGVVDLLNLQQTQSGEFIRKFIEENAGKYDLNNAASWPRGSNLREVARTWETFWYMVGDPKARLDLANQLPQQAKLRLLSLPNRKLEDTEIEEFLVNCGVKPENARLLRETVVEIRDGTGDVKSALEATKK